MANMVQSINFVRRLNRRNFYFQARVFKFWRFIRGIEVDKNVKFQFNISKIIPARPKKTGTWDVHIQL